MNKKFVKTKNIQKQFFFYLAENGFNSNFAPIILFKNKLTPFSGVQ